MTTKKTKERRAPFPFHLSHMNEETTVYIKKESMNNEQIWSVYNIHGERLAYAPTFETAQFIVDQNDLTVFNVH